MLNWKINTETSTDHNSTPSSSGTTHHAHMFHTIKNCRKPLSKRHLIRDLLCCHVRQIRYEVCKYKFSCWWMLKTFCEVMPHMSAVAMKPTTSSYNIEVAHFTEIWQLLTKLQDITSQKTVILDINCLCVNVFVILKKKLKPAILFS